jgi:hypothetical protein
MPRFVVLHHDWPTPHFDLMLEVGGVLKTWRLAVEPINDEPINAVLIADHRLDYLDYEGPVSGNRGNVKRWDGGELEWFEVFEDHVVVVVAGQRLKGAHLLYTDDGQWMFA